MIRRKLVISAIVIMVAVISITAWIGRYSNILNDIDTSDVEEITFHDSYENIALTEQSDIQVFLKELQSMKFKKMLNYHKYGAALVIDIKLKSGNILSMSILSDDIIINGINYRPDKDYRDKVKYIFNTLL